MGDIKGRPRVFRAAKVKASRFQLESATYRILLCICRKPLVNNENHPPHHASHHPPHTTPSPPHPLASKADSCRPRSSRKLRRAAAIRANLGPGQKTPVFGFLS